MPHKSCCVEVFLSWISKHHVRALPGNTLLSPTTAAERFNCGETGHGKPRTGCRTHSSGAEFWLQVLFNEYPNQKAV